MKRIFFYAFCLQLVVMAGCNNSDEKKSTTSDSSATTSEEKKSATPDSPKVDEKKGPALNDMGTELSDDEAKATINHLMEQYPKFNALGEKNMTQHVVFNYDAFLQFITDKDQECHKTATDIYLAYAAYTRGDAKRYVTLRNDPQHPETWIDVRDIANKPCLLEAYECSAGKFKYDDKGSLCPPPFSCSAKFDVVKAMTYARNRFIPDVTIGNYTDTYDDLKDLYLTKSVKFSIAAIKYWKDKFDGLYGKTTGIHFFMGAYTKADAQRNGQEEGKPCLLFAWKDPTSQPDDPKFKFVDFGILIPSDLPAPDQKLKKKN